MGGGPGTLKRDENPYNSPIHLEFVEFNMHINSTKPVLPYGELMEHKKRQTKFLPAEDSHKKTRLGSVFKKTLGYINRMASLKYNNGDNTDDVGGQVL